jgi:hypothetical protein
MGRQGPEGAQGPEGKQGSPGAPGANGVSGYQPVSTGLVSSSLGGDASIFRTVECPAGKRAVGGGGNLSNTSATVVEYFQVLGSNRDSNNERMWRVHIRNTDAVAHTLTTVTSAVCVSAAL